MVNTIKKLKLFLFLFGIVLGNISLGAHIVSDGLLEGFSKFYRYYVREHDRSPAKKKYEVYEKYFNDGGEIPEIDLSDISRRARVIFFSLCTNKNIDFLYGTLLANGKLIDEKIPNANELKKEFFEIQLNKKFKADSSFPTTYYGQKWICCKFDQLLVTIIPKPKKNQHGNFYIKITNLKGDKLTDTYQELIGSIHDDDKEKALKILQKSTRVPTKVDYLEKVFGKNKYGFEIDSLSLLFELEISRRYITRRGGTDEALYNLPFASVISMSTDLGELVECFMGEVPSRRKDAVGTILSKYLKTNLGRLLGGKTESDSDESDAD
ncbi:MAG: hypothetical protein FJX18_06885 [Alphaproteobacteria bacterium]|nr:hypothetical protein [Alphaproteobacteria bacterium]